MKVLLSGPSSRLARTAAAHRLTWVLVAAWAAIHLPSVAPSLEDIDSINFALGLHDFDVARHQPHPPGYPVYIALGRIALANIHVVAPALASVRADALALGLLSVLGGALAIVAAVALFEELTREGDVSPALFAGGAAWLLAVSPLFWVTALRPMSDVPGLAAALWAQVLLLRGTRRRRDLWMGAALTGLAIGLRSQTMWMTLPMLVFALIAGRGEGLFWLVTRPLAAFAAAVAAWAIPLLALTNGIDGYFAALDSQAGEDFAWVDMLVSNPTPRRLAMTVYETLILPWHVPVLAVSVLGAAAVGFAIVARRDRRALGLLVIGFAPYLVFHMLFHETVTVRYALPIVVPVAYLAWRAIAALGLTQPLGIVAINAPVLIVALTGGLAYGSEPHPAFRAIADMRRDAAQSAPGAIFSHYSLRRPLQADPAGLPLVESRRTYEWLGLVDFWRNGGGGPVWFLADPRRTDLALIDPQARRDVTHYTWSAGARGEVSGTRPGSVDWYRLDPPGWFAAEGWALTPETGGIAQATGAGVDKRPITAYVRRRQEPLQLMIGGRDLGPATDSPTRFELAIDGHPIEHWIHDPSVAGANFLRVFALPHGVPAGTGDYAMLTVSAAAVEDGPVPEVAIRQFDLQPASGLMVGFDDGWHEAEYENATGLTWRWTSGSSVLRIVPPQAVRVTLRGESPLRYVREPPTVTLVAGTRTIAELHPRDDFNWTVSVPADALVASDGALRVETNRIYLPGAAEGTSDTRRLGLRLFEVRVEPLGR